MQTGTTHYVNDQTEVTAEILEVGDDERRVMYLTVGPRWSPCRATFIIEGTDFLDKLANEAERLVREFVGDVPPLEPLRLRIKIDPIPTENDSRA
jgi:hypothetical protein